LSTPFVTVTGTEVVTLAFRRLPDKVAKKVVRQAIKKANAPIQAAVKAAMPVHTGAAKRDVKIITSKGPRGWGNGVIAGGVIEGRVRPTKTRGTTWYTFLLERGWTVGKRIRQGQKVVGYTPHKGNLGAQGIRKVPGKWMMRKAMHQYENQVKGNVIVEILKGIETIADKGA
jgi:HK97 gp10 family phage protein